jgi:ferredoxin-type protein NapH
MKPNSQPGTANSGWLVANKWLLLRRLSQFSILGLFLLGPLTGMWIVKGNLASSLTLEKLPLTDPFILLQSLFAGHSLEITAITGALIVVFFYVVVGGRVYCSWVCPINIVTDVAEWIRRKLKINGNKVRFSKNTAYWIFASTLLLALVTGSLAWELINPVTIVFRGILYGMGLAWFVIISILLIDLFISHRAWCGYLCPVGTFYGLVGTVSIIRIAAKERKQCNDCMDCFKICPEPQVITPALDGTDNGSSPVILSGRCTNCARCIDVCDENVFVFSTRFYKEDGMHLNEHKEIMT